MPLLNFISCSAWVPRGCAKLNPDKVEVSKEELKKIIMKTKEDIADLEDDEYQDIDEEDTDHEENCSKADSTAVENQKEDEEEMTDINSKYDMNSYDDEALAGDSDLGKLVVHPSNDDDPLVTVKDEDDKDSEDGDHEILKTDNLIAVGRNDGDSAILEVHIYNSQENHLYCHHDSFLSASPLCMEWCNYDPGKHEPANLLVIGNMSPVIEIWDLDLVGALEPMSKLGKKKKKKKQSDLDDTVQHTGAVTSLAWNKEYHHILASGSSDKTVLLWDLEKGSGSKPGISCRDTVQALQWHPKQPNILLSGSSDREVRMFDCRNYEVVNSWKLDDEVECVIWDPTVDNQCLASTSAGTVYCLDITKKKPLWNLHAHDGTVTGLQMSTTCPGCLVTCSVEEDMKIWDIADGKPSYINEEKLRLGTIISLSRCPDEPFVFCIGGDNKENNLQVLDIRHLGVDVRSRFCERIGLPVDDEMDDSTDQAASALENIQITNEYRNQSIVSESRETGWKPKKSKFGKKKGGHLDKMIRKPK